MNYLVFIRINTDELTLVSIFLFEEKLVIEQLFFSCKKKKVNTSSFII
jgi:hypothetical protein